MNNAKNFIKLFIPNFFLPLLRDLRNKVFVTKIKISSLNPYPKNLSSTSKSIYNQLKTLGYARIESKKYKHAAKIVSNDYLSRIDGLKQHNKKQKMERIYGPSDEIGNNIYMLSFLNSHLHAYFFDSNILAGITRFIGVQPVFRQSPMLEDVNFSDTSAHLISLDPAIYAAAFHTDYYRQLNIMLLLTDITEDTTHTEYAVGSNNRNIFKQGNHLAYPESNRLIAEAGYPIHKLTGKKGDVIIIDTSGFHRACYKENTTRRLLSLVINPNYPFLGYGEDLSGTISNKAPDFISNAIR